MQGWWTEHLHRAFKLIIYLVRNRFPLWLPEAVEVILSSHERHVGHERQLWESYQLFLRLSRCSVYSLHSIGFSAIAQIFRVIEEQSQPTFDENFNFISFFNWTGGNGALSPAVNNAGNGEPKAYTGLVGTHHRPSDDLSTFGMPSSSAEATGVWISSILTAFLTPANAMLSVELGHLADILDAAHQRKNISTLARQWSSRIHDAIWNTTVRLYYEVQLIIKWQIALL